METTMGENFNMDEETSHGGLARGVPVDYFEKNTHPFQGAGPQERRVLKTRFHIQEHT